MGPARGPDDGLRPLRPMTQDFPGIPYRTPAFEAAAVHPMPGPTPGPAPGPAGARDAVSIGRAPFLRRVAAFLLDVLLAEFLTTLLGSVAAAARAVVEVGMNPALWEGAQRNATLLTSQMAPLLLFAYFAYFTAYGGRTPGKMLLGLRVVAADGTPAGPWRCIWRTVCYLASVITWGLGFLLAAGPAGRALHDRLAGTRVVVVARRAPPDAGAAPAPGPR
jgi:uncharacterized RDD family membrane protein YckC